MSDWKKDLENKFNELNKGGESNVFPGNDNGIHHRGNNGRIGGSLHLSSNKEIINQNKVKGGELMIGLEGALQDINDIINGTYNDREAKKVVTLTNDLEKMGAIAKVFLKFLSTMRTNQLLPESEKVRLQKERELRKKAKEALK